MSQPTTELYYILQMAFDFYNKELFNNELPPAMITCGREEGKILGVYSNESLKYNSEIIPEIILNINGFKGDLKNNLATLVHEMNHEYNYIKKLNTKEGCHNEAFCIKSLEIGLEPVNAKNGQPVSKGKRLGQRIIDGGKFDLLTDELLKTINLEIINIPQPEKEKRERKKSKVKYNCPTCGSMAQARPETKLICGEDDTEMEVVEE